MVITLEVLGCPAPKGSGRAMLIKGHAVHVPSGSSLNAKRLRSWDANVREAARSALNGAAAPPFVKQAIAVDLIFRLLRPAGHWGKRGLKPSAAALPIVVPDADKLARATMDSLIGIVFDDDSRIVDLRVRKVYGEPGSEGAHITIAEVS